MSWAVVSVGYKAGSSPVYFAGFSGTGKLRSAHWSLYESDAKQMTRGEALSYKCELLGTDYNPFKNLRIRKMPGD